MAMKGRPGPKHSPTEREEKLLQAAKLDRMGWNQYDIARELKVSQGLVSGYLTKIRERYKQGQQASYGELVEEMVAGYRDIMEEASKAWKLSMLDSRRTVQDEQLRSQKALEEADEEARKRRGKKETSRAKQARLDPKMLVVRLTTTTQGRLPASEYLRIIMSCREAIRDLYGLDAPKKVDMRTTEVTDWNVLAQGLEQLPENEVEAKIQGILQEQLGQQRPENPARPDALPNVIKTVEATQLSPDTKSNGQNGSH